MFLVLQEAMNGQDLDREESIDLSAIEVTVIHGVIAGELSGREPIFFLKLVAGRSLCLPKKGSKNHTNKIFHKQAVIEN